MFTQELLSSMLCQHYQSFVPIQLNKSVRGLLSLWTDGPFKLSVHILKDQIDTNNHLGTILIRKSIFFIKK